MRSDRISGVSPCTGGRVSPDVRAARTSCTRGTPADRGAGARVVRSGHAGRPAAALLAAAALAGLGACDFRPTGNGVYAEKTVDPNGAFVGVRVQDGVGAVITVGPAQKVTLTGDQNIVENSLKVRLEAEVVGSTAVSVLHVFASPTYAPVLPPKAVISVPALAVVRGDDAVVQLARASGATELCGPLLVDLDEATLLAAGYPVASAAVDLREGSVAQLASAGPVTGTVGAGSRLDNSAGAGPCLVTTTTGATVVCN